MSKYVAVAHEQREREKAEQARKAALFDWLAKMRHAEIYIDQDRSMTDEGIPYFPFAIHIMKWDDGDEITVTAVGGATLAEAVEAALAAEGEAK